MEVADGFATLVTRAISESPVVCTPLGDLHDCDWAGYVVWFIVTFVVGVVCPSIQLHLLRRYSAKDSTKRKRQFWI